MNETLTLPSDIYSKLAQGAAERGMTIESLLAAVSELVVSPDQPKERDRERSERIASLFERCRAGRMRPEDRRELDQLIETDYQEANARADQRIAEKKSRAANGLPRDGRTNGSPRSAKRSRK